MYKMLSKKDIIEINRDHHTGKLSNEGSLDFAVSRVYRSKNWLKTVAILTRAILIDHVFEDGNKRTAAGVIAGIMEMNNVDYDVEKIAQIVIRITKENITNVNQIERVIMRARK